MNIYVLFGLLGVCSFSLAAPEPPSWPYSHDLRYYYGYPGKTPYVYRASIEDDEEPVDRSRQDSGQLVSTLIHNAAVKQQDELKNFGNERPAVETGSASPVQQERPGDSPKVVAPSAPNVVKPGVVNPPAFPPARKPSPPPAPTKPAPEEEDEDDEDDEESNEDDEEDEEDEEEEEADEERRRNEPIDVVTTQTPGNATSLESLEVTPSNASQPVLPVVEDDSNANGAVLDVVEIKPDTDDDVSEEASLDGVEAFVPGYVTDQGEVLVPVDTVTGDQPISIVPDPYTPPSRGVPLNYYGYNAGGLPGRVYRQEVFGEEEESQEDESQEDEDEEDESVKEVKEDAKKKQALPPPKPQKVPLHLIPASAPTNEDDELEGGHQRYRNEAFPPSRSPLLYPVTFRVNGGYLTGPFDRPVASDEVFQYVEPRPVVRRRPAVSPNNIFYAYTQQQQRRRTPQPITVAIPASTFYQTRRTQSPSRPVSGQGFLPYAYAGPRPTYSNEQYFPSYRPTTLHNPGEKLKIKSSYELLVEPHSGSNVRLRTKKRPNKKRVSNKKKTQSVKRRPVTVISRPPAVGPNPYRQPVAPYRQPQMPYRQPGPASQAPVLYRPVYNVRPLQRVPAQGQGYRQPPYVSSAYNEYQNFLKGLAAGYYGNRPTFNRPTPVIQQDEPTADSSEATAGLERKPKTRREAKKVKKQKKVANKKKEDPLNLFPLKKETKKPNM